MKRAHLLIHGRVQGVFFRHNTKKRAQQLGLVGFVRNLKDGTVEVVCQGEDKAVDLLIEYCKRGPLIARVDDVEITEQKPKDEFKNFEIRF